MLGARQSSQGRLGQKRLNNFNGPVAQLAERRSYKADVVRAIRTGTTNMQC